MLAASLSACQSEDTLSRPDASAQPRTKSYAIKQDGSTALGRALTDDEKANPGKSGFRLLGTGSESLAYRIALIQAAEKSIDLQYYTIHDDVSANLLLEALLRAAQRGVRVRFLIDNISMSEVGRSLTVLDGMKNIEIRVFNPPVTRHQSIFGRVASYINDFSKLFKRMHNKALISDNQLAIIGGRNLGDEYFEAHTDDNFKDTDILSAGPITNDVSHSFDRYWNAEESFPITQLRKPNTDHTEADKLRAELKAHWEKEIQTDDGKKLLNSNLAQRLKKGEVGLLWAKAELRADEPEKVTHDSDVAHSKPLSSLEKMGDTAKKEFILVSPYFVPQDDGVAWLVGLVKKGIKVKVLTNSLASTDVVAVHTGYTPYREALLKGGVELYEFKATGNKRPRQRLFGGSAPAHASLHAKAYVIDGKTVLIGSFNLDPRSEALNTEIAMVVHHPTIAGQVMAMFNEAIAPDSSYKVTLDENGSLVWTAKEKGVDVEYHREPEAGVRNVQYWLMSLLPGEHQL